MVTNTSSFISSGKLAGRAVACAPSLGFSSPILNGTGVSGVFETRPVSVSVSGLDLSLLPVRERGGNERPIKALAAGVVARAKAQAYVLAAASAGARTQQQMTHDHEMWAFRGPEPWSPPA